MRGVSVEECKSITEEILLYFEKLYASPTGESWLDRDKAPGPDGFTTAVFQDCWDVIKENLKIAKVLSGRLRRVLHETIHYTQDAFVQGRQILDAVLIANEIVDERRRLGEEEKKGFSPRWRKWMSGCLSSVFYAILVNGSAKGEEDLQTLKSLLLVFGHISGLKVNLDKSSIYGINLDQVHLSRLAEMLDCKASG
ncbi:hypothetical protein CK203_090605 [Vitis vinifera]|uniref:Reverse transcriptase domain-containing protein n=1 Tax=Vitis vinifera TaxID=29760 RepID=A0A438DVV2_VITVI|nr:hypothetical protein CK203_090605 [Vitis vinifera]